MLMGLSFSKGKMLTVATGKRNMENFKPGEWNELVLSGKIDKNADQLAIGALYDGQAKFLYDGMQLTIKGQEIPLRNGDFEDEDMTPWKFANKPALVTTAITAQLAFSGKHSLCIDALSGAYGSNNKAGHYVNINGNRIYYEEYGEGTPLLLLHGALQSIDAFYNQIPQLSKSFKVIAVDTRGHGKSTADSTRLTYELYADDMNKLLDSLHLDSVNVLGWSDGGNTGLILAMQHPEKVKKLAVTGAVLFNDHTSILAWVNDTIRNQIANMEKTGEHSFELRVKQCLLDEPHISPNALKAIQCPVLVMVGEHDVVKPAHTELIAKSITHSELVIFKNATHDVPADVPEQFNKTVETFLLK